MAPTRHRSAPALLLEYSGELILIDCGEGTQRQMHIAGKSRSRVRKILLTHWHGDHVGGLGPLLQTTFHGPYEGQMELYGPGGTTERLGCLARAIDIDLTRVRVTDLQPADGEVRTFVRNECYELRCAPMRHGLLTVGYAFEELPRRRIDLERARALGLEPGPLLGRLQRGETVEFAGRRIAPEDVSYMQQGKKAAFVTDTVATPDIVSLAHHADLLVCEATYCSKHEDLACAYNHMTAAQAAVLAREAQVRRLVLTHFSQRYETVTTLLEEARPIFPETTAAEDFLTVNV
jgi:ribonuclease Z